MPLYTVDDVLAYLDADLATMTFDDDVEGLFGDNEITLDDFSLENEFVVETLDDIRDLTLKQQQDYRDTIHDYVSKFPLSRRDRRKFLSVIGMNKHSNHMRASNFRGRRKLSLVMITEFLEVLEKFKDNPNFQAWFVTFKDKRFDTTDKLACVNLYSFKDNCQKEIRKIPGLNGVGVMEIQVVTNYPRKGLGRYWFVGCHALLWSIEEDVDLSPLNSTGKFQSAFDNQGIHISQVDELTEMDFATIAAYMCKVPLIGKTLNEIEETEYEKKKYYLKSDMKVRPTVLLRIVEVLSNFKITEMVFASGDGTLVWKNLDKALRETQDRIDRVSKGIRRSDVDDRELHEFWENIWTACPWTSFDSPMEMIGNRRDMPKTAEWTVNPKLSLQKIP